MIRIFSVFFWLTFSIFTIILGSFIFIFSIFSDDRFLHNIGRLWGKLALKLAFVKVIYKELSDFNKNQPYIIMANHQSAFDIFTLFAYLPLQFRWVSKKENAKIPIVGQAMKIMGEIFVDRENIKGLKGTINTMKNCLDRGISVLIFPEGTRSRDGELLPFKKGGFFLAVNSEREILPVAIWGTKDVNRVGSFIIHPFRKISLLIGKPIKFEKKGNMEDKMKEIRIILLDLVEKAKKL